MALRTISETESIMSRLYWFLARCLRWFRQRQGFRLCRSDKMSDLSMGTVLVRTLQTISSCLSDKVSFEVRKRTVAPEFRYPDSSLQRPMMNFVVPFCPLMPFAMATNNRSQRSQFQTGSNQQSDHPLIIPDGGHSVDQLFRAPQLDSPRLRYDWSTRLARKTTNHP